MIKMTFPMLIAIIIFLSIEIVFYIFYDKIVKSLNMHDLNPILVQMFLQMVVIFITVSAFVWIPLVIVGYSVFLLRKLYKKRSK